MKKMKIHIKDMTDVVFALNVSQSFNVSDITVLKIKTIITEDISKPQ